MKIIRYPKQMYTISKSRKLEGKTVGFVPTMGALHEGHLSLIRRARKENDVIVVSIFVNPAQFGKNEDFTRYPRPEKKDILSCQNENVDFVFYPKPENIYPKDYRTFVDVEGLSGLLCGKSRPGHFRGVATIVNKLFNIVQPDITYFGQKDAQQTIIIKRMVKDLNMPVKIKVLPTIREKDGLALSSRNIYLNTKERKDALVLFQSLESAKGLIKRGACPKEIIADMRGLIQSKKTARIDYIAIVDKNSLLPLKKSAGSYLIALAVRIGKTRLIDNIVING